MDSFQALYKLLINDSIWKESSKTRVCVLTAFALASRNEGKVDAAYSHIAHVSGVTREEAVEAIKAMEGIGSDSLFRLVRNDTVWRFPAFKKVLRLSRTGSAEHAPLRSTSRGIGGYVYYAVCGTKVKIGFSRNPWSRVREIARSVEGTTLAAYERGTYAREKYRHRQFEEFNIHGEWFELSPEVELLIEKIQGTKPSKR